MKQAEHMDTIVRMFSSEGKIVPGISSQPESTLLSTQPSMQWHMVTSTHHLSSPLPSSIGPPESESTEQARGGGALGDTDDFLQPLCLLLLPSPPGQSL